MSDVLDYQSDIWEEIQDLLNDQEYKEWLANLDDIYLDTLETDKNTTCKDGLVLK